MESGNRNCFVAILLCALVFLIYSNTFQVPWHFDDEDAIVNNPNLHFEKLELENLKQSLFRPPGHRDQTGKIYRPVSNVTFALNWFFGRDAVSGYHFVNIAIHCTAAVVLYLTIVLLFQTPNGKGRDPDQVVFVSLLSATLWAVNPIQTQAVTYIVQRMTSLSALFYLLGIYFFLRARMASSRKKRWVFWGACLISGILALGAKEHTVTLPLSLLLFEAAFFRGERSDSQRVRWMRIIGACALMLLIAVGVLLSRDLVTGVLGGYEQRTFTLLERLLTECRVLVLYFSLIFFPAPTRLSIEHDVFPSVSLLQPWTTLPSILLLAVLVGAALFHLKRHPLIAAPVLFFFISHLVESTILPLELIFEHRNYLPSMFLFLPIALGLNRLILQYRQRNAMKFLLLAFCILLIVGLGSGTFIRNMTWKSQKSLWEDAMRKAPLSSRPPYNLAALYYQPKWMFSTALSLYERSLASPQVHIKGAKVDSLINMATIYSENGDYGKAIQLSRKAVEWDVDNNIARKILISNLLLAGHVQEAEKQADYLLQTHYLHEWPQCLKGLVLLHQQRYEDAILYLNNAITLNPDLTDALVAGGIAYSKIGENGKATYFYERALQIPFEITSEEVLKNTIAHFGLIDSALAAGKMEDAARYTERFLAERSILKIKKDISKLSDGKVLWPLPPKRVARYIGNFLEERGQEIRGDVP